jgi:hypothetical protein
MTKSVISPRSETVEMEWKRQSLGRGDQRTVNLVYCISYPHRCSARMEAGARVKKKIGTGC